jgi:uncharacterized protein YkwD
MPRHPSARHLRVVVRRACPALVAGLVLLGVVSLEPQRAAWAEQRPEAVLTLLNIERDRLLLPTLQLSAELVEAAQAHASDMATQGYLALRSPEGLEIEDWAESAGYGLGRVAEKLLETNASLAEVLAGWGRSFSDHRDTVFADWARDLGVGTARRPGSDNVIYVLVVGVDARGEAQASAEGLTDLELVRAQLVERVNRFRSGAGLRPLTPHPALDRVAQARAEEQLAAGDTPRRRRLDFADRAAREGYQARRIAANAMLGPESVETAVERWVASEEHRDRLLELYWTDTGSGVAFRVTDEGLMVSWVQVLANRAGL